jgi:hypothetical protein
LDATIAAARRVVLPHDGFLLFFCCRTKIVGTVIVATIVVGTIVVGTIVVAAIVVVAIVVAAIVVATTRAVPLHKTDRPLDTPLSSRTKKKKKKAKSRKSN